MTRAEICKKVYVDGQYIAETSVDTGINWAFNFTTWLYGVVIHKMPNIKDDMVVEVHYRENDRWPSRYKWEQVKREAAHWNNKKGI